MISKRRNVPPRIAVTPSQATSGQILRPYLSVTEAMP